MKPLDLIETARRLTEGQASGRPNQSDLKRAVSSVYYALFHALCRNLANCLIGKEDWRRHGRRAWKQAYRAMEHWHAKNQCENKKKNKEILSKFPVEIRDFAGLFVELQAERHAADYDPASRFEKNEVIRMIDGAESVIKAFNEAKIADKRAFAAWTALKHRGSADESRPGAQAGVKSREGKSASSPR